jgi:hypothetical protein
VLRWTAASGHKSEPLAEWCRTTRSGSGQREGTRLEFPSRRSWRWHERGRCAPPSGQWGRCAAGDAGFWWSTRTRVPAGSPGKVRSRKHTAPGLGEFMKVVGMGAPTMTMSRLPSERRRRTGGSAIRGRSMAAVSLHRDRKDCAKRAPHLPGNRHRAGRGHTSRLLRTAPPVTRFGRGLWVVRRVGSSSELHDLQAFLDAPDHSLLPPPDAALVRASDAGSSGPARPLPTRKAAPATEAAIAILLMGGPPCIPTWGHADRPATSFLMSSALWRPPAL